MTYLLAKFVEILIDRWYEVLFAAQDHLVLVLVPIACATLVTIPLGILALGTAGLKFQ